MAWTGTTLTFTATQIGATRATYRIQ